MTSYLNVRNMFPLFSDIDEDEPVPVTSIPNRRGTHSDGSIVATGRHIPSNNSQVGEETLSEDNNEIREETIDAEPDYNYNIGYSLWDYLKTWSPVKPCDDDPECYKVSVPFFSLLFVGLILIVSCVPPSFHYVHYDQYGLIRNNYGDVHLSPTLTQGRYFLPLNFGVVFFPADYQLVDFDSTVFADNGMEFGMNVKFYYRIPEDMVGVIYDRYSKSYGSRIYSNSKKIIKNSVTGFGIEDYLSNRSHIESVIAANISTSLEELMGVEVPQNYVRIIKLDIPEILISTSLDSALALQRNELNQITQAVSLVQSETTELVASIDSSRILLLENADNYARQIVGTAEATSTNIINSARAVGMSSLFDYLNITDTSQKEAMIKAMAVYDAGDAGKTVMHGVTGGSLVNV